MHNVQDIIEAKEFILSKTTKKPKIGLILGSGLGNLADEIENPISIPYSEIPHFAKSSAVGHANELVIGTLNGKTVAAMKGRFHYYEGFTLDEVTFPVRVMKALEIETLIVTNACGAVNTNFKPGDLMLITDHINLVGANPLIGPNNDELGTRFPDLAKKQNITLQQGVYAWWSGPTYESPAEVRMIRVLGADACGMSTVPEAIIATHASMKVLGISCLTNMACGILDQPLNHEEVIEVAGQVNTKFVGLIKGILEEI